MEKVGAAQKISDVTVVRFIHVPAAQARTKLIGMP